MSPESTWAPSTLAFVSGLAAFAVAAFLTPLARRVAVRAAFLDRPGSYKAHDEPTALLGGIAVVAATLIGLASGWALLEDGPRSRLLPLVAGLVVITLAGLVDDLRGLSPRAKIVWQLLATLVAGALLVGSGLRLNLFLEWGPLPLALLTLLWVVAITNSINFLDNMNGSCAGVGAIASIGLATYNLHSGEFAVAVMSTCLAGACLGFLPFNYPKARIFLGDSGSMAIGFALATLSVLGVYTTGAEVPVLAILAPLMILAVPIADMVVVILLRFLDGHPPWIGDRRHLNHRLVRRGMRHGVAVATMWLATAACGLVALLLRTTGLSEAPLLIAAVVCVIGVLFLAAGRRGLPPKRLDTD